MFTRNLGAENSSGILAPSRSSQEERCKGVAENKMTLPISEEERGTQILKL